MNSFRVFRLSNRPLISSLLKERWAARPHDLGDRSRSAAFDLPHLNIGSSDASAGSGQHPTRKWCAQRSCCAPTNIPSGVTWPLLVRWAVPTGRYASGAAAAGRGRHTRKPRGRAGRAFFPSAVRARVTALACTLPRDSGKPLSRWSASELARAVIQRGIVANISASTVKRWLAADQIKPWQYCSWQHPTDPRFLEKSHPHFGLVRACPRIEPPGPYHRVRGREDLDPGPQGQCGHDPRRTWPRHPCERSISAQRRRAIVCGPLGAPRRNLGALL